MATITITIDTVEEFFKKYENENYIVKGLREFQSHIDEIDFNEPGDEMTFKIKFKSEVSWPQVAYDMVNMKADECWSVKGDKTVVLWWD